MTLSSVRPIATNYGEHEAAMAAYRSAGEARARALGNRGPIRLNADGSLREDILEAYWRCGFYVFENVLRPGRASGSGAGYRPHPGSGAYRTWGET